MSGYQWWSHTVGTWLVPGVIGFGVLWAVNALHSARKFKP